jgi:DNA polymerase III delta subunit
MPPPPQSGTGRPGPADEGRILEAIGAGDARPLYLVTGEPVLAEAAARRIADAVALPKGVRVESFRRPADLGAILADLRTYSLFGSGKVTIVVDSAVLSDRRAAAYLIDQAAEALPIDAAAELTGAGRQAAGRLLQVCRFFGLTVGATSARQTLDALPAWAFEGAAASGGRGRGKKRSKAQVDEVKAGLAMLLDLAVRDGVQGYAESDAVELAAIAASGLPAGHHLVLCEAAVADDHPLVERLRSERALLALVQVDADRAGKWQGLDELRAELERETQVSMSDAALEELARRTLRRRSDRGASGTDPDSTARFAAEFRKLVSLADSRSIEVELVEQAVEDRGEEDVWALLDAIGAGRLAEALGRLRRLVDSAEDPMQARLAFFGQLASLCRQLTAVAGMVEVAGIAPGERNYNRFRERQAPKLQAGTGDFRPLADLHPYRLHRAYLAASRIGAPILQGLPARVLETELRLKGESGDPDAALTDLIAFLAGSQLQAAQRRGVR